MDATEFNKSMEQECKKLFPDFSSKDWDKIWLGSISNYIASGTLSINQCECIHSSSHHLQTEKA